MKKVSSNKKQIIDLLNYYRSKEKTISVLRNKLKQSYNSYQRLLIRNIQDENFRLLTIGNRIDDIKKLL